MINDVLNLVVDGCDLNQDKASEVMQDIMTGKVSDIKTAAFLTAMRLKGPTVDEITAFAKIMRHNSMRISTNLTNTIDTCGTGGDGKNTFNISTAAAFVTAAAGIPVAKHGNRAFSSKSGSADVLEALGINIMLDADSVKGCIEKTGIGFMFAPMFHPSMKYAAPVRKELGFRTVFNILGPLTNPAGANYQLMGVYDIKLVDKLAVVLGNLGVKRAMVVHGNDGMDEITSCDKTYACMISEGKLTQFEINPTDFIDRISNPEEIEGGDAKTNSEYILSILNGTKGAKRDIVLLNAAAAIYTANKSETMQNAFDIAAKTIDSGKALQKLYQLKEYTQSKGN